MKASDILLRAAYLVEQGRHGFGCNAILEAAGNSDHMEAIRYFEHFKPRNTNSVWFGASWIPKNRDRRVVALTLAAAIASSKGD